jgi:tripartite-type tricarboxylate transporter receptor subunit TctC
VPAKTPKPVIDKLSAAVAKAVQSADVVEKIKGMGSDPAGTTPEECGAVFKKDRERWVPIIKASGFKAE